tara:strand:+ start:272 stop:481 length:210 start_codon:yes stop_codon:yes gene_type:complete
MKNINMHDFARILVEAHQPKAQTNALAQDLRVEAMKNLFDGLTFNQATTTSEWDALTCDDQMTLEDLIG